MFGYTTFIKAAVVSVAHINSAPCVSRLSETRNVPSRRKIKIFPYYAIRAPSLLPIVKSTLACREDISVGSLFGSKKMATILEFVLTKVIWRLRP